MALLFVIYEILGCSAIMLYATGKFKVLGENPFLIYSVFLIFFTMIILILVILWKKSWANFWGHLWYHICLSVILIIFATLSWLRLKAGSLTLNTTYDIDIAKQVSAIVLWLVGGIVALNG